MFATSIEMEQAVDVLINEWYINILQNLYNMHYYAK